MIRRITNILTMVILMALMLPSFAFADNKPLIITKQYNLIQYEKYVNFILEGYDGEYSVELTFPDGHKVVGAKTNEVKDGNTTQWEKSFVINGAPKGTYTFKITAPKSAYYNLRIHIPLFYDIADHWAEKRISDFVQKGIVKGYGDGSFKPDKSVTGEELVAMAVNVLTEENPSGARQWKKSFRWQVQDPEQSKKMGFHEFNFTTLNTGNWATPFLTAAGDIAITKDWQESDLKQPFSRKDVALFLANVLQMTKVNEAQSSGYSDTAVLEEKYIKAIDLLSSFTIINGYPDGTFKPVNKVTRAEAVTLLSRLSDYMD